MAKYTVYFTQTASTQVEVEADSFNDAVDAAYNDLPRGLCAQCSGWGRDNGPGIDLSGDWEADETTYSKDGEIVQVRREA